MMIKHVRVLSVLAFFFSFPYVNAQILNCSLSDSESGYDNDATTAEVSDFSCVDTVANTFITGITIDASIGSNCVDYYDFSIEINGNSVQSGLCNGTYDLSNYEYDLNTITSIAIVSNDNDGSDYITMDLTVDISYTVTSCPPPSGLEVSSIETTTALFSWDPNGSEVLWDVELVDITAGDTATGTPTNYAIITDSLELSSLTPDNMYDIYVRAYCGTGTDIQSLWIGPISFATVPTCLPVSDVEVDDVLDISATALWSSSETEWAIELIDVTNGESFVGIPNYSSLTDTFYNFTGLTPEHTYSFKIQSNCGPVDGNSTWSSINSFTTDPSCMAPIDLSTEVLSDSSVVLTWVSVDNESEWGVEIINIDNGESADSIVDYTVTDTTLTINGLDGNTTYQVFVNAMCSSSDVSDWTGGVSFTTLCGVYVPDYLENFNDYLDPCWAESEGPLAGPDLSDVTSAWVEDDYLNISGTNKAAKINLFTTSANEWLISPYFDLSNGGYEINLDVAVTNWNSSGADNMGIADTVRLMQTLDEGVTWTEIYNWNLSNQPNNSGENFSIDISSNTNSNVQFAVYAVYGSGSTTDYDFFVDNFRVRTIPLCVSINSLEATNVFATTADLNWSVVGTETSWQIEYGINGFTQGSGQFEIASDSTFSLVGLTSDSEYQVFVRAICGSSDSSSWTGPINFSTLCETYTPNYVQDFNNYLDPCWSESEGPISGPYLTDTTSSWIEDDYLNISGPNKAAKINLYTSSADEWLISPLFDLSLGGYEINLDVAVTNWNTSGVDNMGSEDTVWVMQSLDGGSTWESIYNWNLSNQPSNTGENVSIDLSTLTNSNVRFAIYATYGSGSSTDYDFFVDDFKVRTIPTCPELTNIVISNTLAVTSDVSWTAPGAETSWQIEYGLNGFAQGTGDFAIANDTTHTLTGLTESSNYQVYVRGICAVGDSSEWVGPVSFTTLISNDIEVSNFVSPVSQGCMLTTAEEVVITITNNGGFDASGFDVSYSFDGINYISDGIFTGTLAANTDTAYTLSTTFDFSTAIDTNLFVAVDLATDTTQIANDTNSYEISNLGDELIQLEITTGNFAYENSWYIKDTLTNTTVASHTNGSYSDGTTYNYDVCITIGNTYSMEAWDSYGDGWNGGIYTLTQCGGVLVANNGGLSPTTSPNAGGLSLEAQDIFTVEECDDYDLGIVSMDSISSTCGMTATEQGYLLVQNYGILDITSAMNVSVQYQVNGSGWANLATLSSLASGADTLLALPTVDMTTPLTYTFEFQVIYALDENAANNTLDLDIESVDTYTDVTQDFDDAPSGWTAHVISGTALSWEWGIPTTPVISANVDGSAWVTRLNNDMFLNEASYLLSPCFDFSGYSNDVEFAFDYIWTTTGGSNQVRFEVSTDGGQTWSTELTMPTNTVDWTLGTGIIDLAGESDVKFRFRMNNSYSTDAEGFGMDNFQVFEHVLYTDTTLADLRVDGLQISGFDPAVFNYTYELAYGTTVVPTVDATVNAAFYESMVITQAPAIPGIATVVVTAEDTNFIGTYTVNFTEAPASTNAYLSDISGNGNPISGFDSLIFVYDVTLPYGSSLPNVVYTLSDTNASGIQTNTGSVPGSVSIEVTAEDGVTTNTYIINYDEEPADTVSTLSDLTAGGPTVTGFTPSTLNYTEPTIFPTVLVNHIDYTPTSALSTVVVSPVGPYTGPTLVTVTVTAQDGSSTVYTVDLVAPLSNDASLSDLTYDDGVSDVTVPGFHTDSLTYTIELPFGSFVPDVGYTTTDGGSTGVITNASGVPGTTTVTVTAADGTVRVYTIHWTEAPASDNNLLATLLIGSGTNGVLWQGDLGTPYVTQGFNPLVNIYRFYVSDLINASIIHQLTTTLQDVTASKVEVHPLVYPGTYTVTVTAENGDVNVYIIHGVRGIGQNELDAGTVSMYPNPSTGIVNVEVKEDISNYSIEVISTTGQKVFSTEYTNDNTQVVLDLSFVADGMYYVVVKDAETGKFAREKITIFK